MKLLYLHDGNVFVGTMAYNMGFDVISFNIFDFDFEMYPVNHFDILWVNLSCEISQDLRTDHLEYVVDDVLYYYELKHWIIEYPDRRIQDNIVVWGVPFTDINYVKEIPLAVLDSFKFVLLTIASPLMWIFDRENTLSPAARFKKMIETIKDRFNPDTKLAETKSEQTKFPEVSQQQISVAAAG